MVGFCVVLLVGLVAAVGLAGVRTSTASAAGEGYTLEVLHASLTRPGLATPFQITVRARDGSLPESLTLRVASGYLKIFDEHGLTPTPVESHRDPQWTEWTFRLPAGSEVLSVTLDARLEPSVQWRRKGGVELMVDGEARAETHITTWVLP